MCGILGAYGEGRDVSVKLSVARALLSLKARNASKVQGCGSLLWSGPIRRVQAKQIPILSVCLADLPLVGC